MDKLREWGFPVVLIVAWMVAAAYTVSLLIGPREQATGKTTAAASIRRNEDRSIGGLPPNEMAVYERHWI